MKKVFPMGAVFLAILFAAMPQVASNAAREALSLCAHTLIPSLFPFMVCANVLLSLGVAEKTGRLFSSLTRKLFRVDGQGAAAVILGFISGYPAGAVVSAGLYRKGAISKSEAERLLGFTNNAGPLFILGAVGSMLYKSQAAGIVLYISVVLASLLTGVCMRFYASSDFYAPKQKRNQKNDPMGDAVSTILTLSGYVVFFAVMLAFLEKGGVLSVLCRMFRSFGMGNETASLLSMGIFEISTAAKKATGALPAMAALLSFGGLSVLMQTAAVVKKAGLSLKPYILGKAISSVFAAAVCNLILKFFPITLQTAALSKAQVYTEYLSAATAMAMGVYLVYRLLCKFCVRPLAQKRKK
ncbi:MAG: hypothetical protein IJN74_01135 [Clostridia bacterium]|nr:hypothetical protein [Clostridia bacterium]